LISSSSWSYFNTTHEFHDGLDRFGTTHIPSLPGFAVLHLIRSLVERYPAHCNIQSHRIAEAGLNSV
jgi:hypothetical protein